MKKFWKLKALDKNTGELTLYGEISNETWWGDEVTPKEFKAELDGLGDIDTLNVYINSRWRCLCRSGYSLHAKKAQSS